MRTQNLDIELFRRALEHNKLHLSFAKVISVSIASDRSQMRATVELLPDEYEARVTVGAEYVAPGVGIYTPLRQNDLVLVAFPSADQDNGVLIKRISSQEDTVPEEFNNDKVVIKCVSNEEFVLVSDKMRFGTNSSDENLVLGQVFKSMMSDVLEAIADHLHVGNLGYYTAPPHNASFFTSTKASPIDDEAILSDKGFTEK